MQINGIVSRLVLGSTLNLSVPIATAKLVFSLDETNPEGLIQREPVSPLTRIVLDSMHGKLSLGV